VKKKPAKSSQRSAAKPQRLLVPVDFSASSVRALRHAMELAKRPPADASGYAVRDELQIFA
jgi:hypothetical protein